MKNIFILEDEEIIGKLYKKRLIQEGFSVETSTNTKNSKEIILKNNIDIALLDHGLKDEKNSGLDLVQFIRENSPKTKIIMLSNYNHEELLYKAKKEGIDDFLIKINYSPKKLAEYLKKL